MIATSHGTASPSKGMAESDTFGSRIFGAMTAVISEPNKYSQVMLLIYILVAGLAIGVILLVVDAYVPFLPVNPLSGPSAMARRSKKFWSGLVDDAQNLMVPATASTTTTASDYTVSVQILLQDSRTPLNGRYRHILHRGTNPCNLSVTNPGPTGHNNIQPSDIPDADPGYLQTGLPPFMNPGFFLDPMTNDLHVFVHTKGQEAGGQVLWLESATVEDLPLNTPTTIGVALSGQTLEVYVNCRLYSTTLLRGKPFLPSKDMAAWFGRACAFPFTGVVQNLTLWPTALNSGDYLQVCRSADFSKVALPSICPTAGRAGSGSGCA